MTSAPTFLVAGALISIQLRRVHLSRSRNNIFAHAVSRRRVGAITLEKRSARTVVTGNIIYEWGNPIVDKGNANTMSPNEINLCGYRDPNRTVETYNASLGGAPKLSDFLQKLANKARTTGVLNTPQKA